MIQISVNPKPCVVCQHYACICLILIDHESSCLFRRAATGPVEIECEHGRSVCPRCDPCTCDQEVSDGR